MSNQTRMYFKFSDVNGRTRIVNRSTYKSAQEFKDVADDVLINGLWIGDIGRKYDLNDTSMIEATFREGPGQAWLVKRIIEDGVTPHPSFSRHRSGQRVLEIVDMMNKEQQEPVDASELKEQPEPVDVEDDWRKRVNEQVDRIESKHDKIEAYDRTVEWIKDTLPRIKSGSPMADTLKLVLESLGAE